MSMVVDFLRHAALARKAGRTLSIGLVVLILVGMANTQLALDLAGEEVGAVAMLITSGLEYIWRRWLRPRVPDEWLQELVQDQERLGEFLATPQGAVLMDAVNRRLASWSATPGSPLITGTATQGGPNTLGTPRND